MSLLKREAELEEIVRLVGMDSLAPADRLLLEGAKMVREDFLHQNAFEPVDTYTSLKKQFHLLDVILGYYRLAKEALDKGSALEELLALPVKERIARAKLIPEEDMAEFDEDPGRAQGPDRAGLRPGESANEKRVPDRQGHRRAAHARGQRDGRGLRRDRRDQHPLRRDAPRPGSGDRRARGPRPGVRRHPRACRRRTCASSSWARDWSWASRAT